MALELLSVLGMFVYLFFAFNVSLLAIFCNMRQQSLNLSIFVFIFVWFWISVYVYACLCFLFDSLTSVFILFDFGCLCMCLCICLLAFFAICDNKASHKQHKPYLCSHCLGFHNALKRDWLWTDYRDGLE